MNRNKLCISAVVLLMVIVSMGILLFFQCKFEEPVAPYWNVNFTLPLLAESYTMVDLAEDVKEINIRNNIVWVNIEEDFGSEKVGDKLKINGTTKSTTIPNVQGSGSISDSVSIPGDNIILQSAEIKSGRLTVELENQGSSALSVYLELKDLQKDGNTFFIEENLDPYELKTIANEKLDNYVFLPPVYSGKNFVRFDASLSGGNGDVNVSVELSELIFSSVTGTLDDVEVKIDSLESDFDIPEEFENFAVDEANLQIAFNSTITFPFDVDITIEALESRNTLPAPIHISESIDPSGTDPDTVDIGDIADFLNSQPTKILVYGDASIGRGLGSHSITENDSISGKVLFNAPLTVSIPSLKSKMEPDTITIDEDAQDFLRDNLISAEFNAEVENGLPIGTNVSIVFSQSRSDTLIYESGNYDLKFDLNLKKAPTSNTVPARVTGTEHSILNITLEENELSHFINNDTLYVGFLFEFLGPNVLTKFRPQDYIEIEAYISALVNTKEPEDEE